MGDRGTRRRFGILLLAAWAAMAAGLLAEAPFGAAALGAGIPLGILVYRPIHRGTSGRDLNPVLKATARYHLVLGLLWAGALAAS